MLNLVLKIGCCLLILLAISSLYQKWRQLMQSQNIEKIVIDGKTYDYSEKVLRTAAIW